jgi:hypothetical protein
MIDDALLKPSGALTAGGTGQSLVGAAGTTLSTNVIDLASLGQRVSDVGAGQPLEFVITVTQAFAGGTSMQPAIILADDAAMSVNVEQVLIDSAIPIAQLTLGVQIPLHFDRAGPLPPRRYLALQYTTIGTMTAGAVSASMAASVQDRSTIYQGGFVVQ